MTEDILGISGQMDISDIQASIDKLCDGLNRVGADTDALSQRMTKALNDIANSNGDLASKTTQAMQTLKSAMDEAAKELDVVPSMIDNANKRVETIEGTIDKLNEKLAETEKGSDAFNSITKQIDAQKQSLQLAKEDVVELTRSYENVKNSISEVNGAYQTLNALSIASTTTNGAQSTSNIAVGVSATAAATATTAEAAAHTANSAAALKNAEAENQNVQATQQLTAALQEYMSISSGRAEIERMQAESTKELNADIKMYEESIKEIQTILDTTDFSKKIEEATAKIEEQKAKLEQYKEALANLSKEDNETGNGANYYNKLIDDSQQKIEQLQTKISEWSNEQKRLNADAQEYNTLLEAAKKIQAGEKIADGFKKATEEAKKTAKETEEVGKSADDAAKKVGGIFSKFKNTLGGALKGNFSGLFSIFGKIGVWGAALAAVGKGIYELTIRAEEFRNALQPLSHYLDESNLQAVRQNILALSDETAKSVSDMAAAATQFVKVWDSLRDSPEALTTMIKSSNEFGALSGKTSEEGAKFLSNLASEYHMTAQEATEASAMIATAAHNSTSSFGEMADAISSAGSSAALYGVSFKEMATLIGYSSNQFGGAQKSASKFSMLLMSMSKLQDKYNPSVVGMITALQNLKEAYDNGEHVENNFMARQRSIAMYFIKNADAIAKYNKGIDSNTAKQELLNDINARASVNVAKLQNAWDGFLTAVNANLTPTLTRILNFFAKIIGGAQKTADELNYLKNFDNIHKGAKRGMQYTESVTSGWTAGFQESAIANMGARQQYNLSKEDGLKQYRKQRDRLKRIYQQGLKNAQNTWKNASSNAYAKSAGNFALQYYNKNRSSFSEFTPQMFNNFLRNQRNSTISLLQKPINSNTNLGGNGYVPKPKKDNSADQQRNYREQLAEQQAKQLADDKKIEWKLYVAEQEEGIAKEHDANEKELKQRKLDFEKKKHQIEEEAESLRQKNIQIAKAEYSKNPANKKKEGFYASGLDKGVKLTDEQQQLIDTKMSTLNAQQDEDNKKRLAAQLQSLYDYLKEYGTVQEQRYAIAKEYDEKILQTADENQKKILQKQKEAALAQTDAKKLAMGIDWGASFEGVGNVLKDLAKDTLSKVEEYMKTSEFKQSNASDKKAYVELRDKLRSETEDKGSFNFGKWDDVANDVRAYQNSVKWLQKATKAHDDAIADRDKAEKEIKNAISDKAQEIAKLKFEKANERVRETGQEQTDAENNVQGAQQSLTDSTDEATKGLRNFQEMLGEITSGSLSGFAKGIGTLINNIAGKSTAVGDALQGLGGKVGGLVGAILQLIDAIGDDPTGFIDNLFDKITKVIENVLSQLPQIVWSALKGIGGIIGGIVKGVGNLFTGGAIDKWFGGNGKKVNDSINNLTESNNRLLKSIDKLKDTMSGTYGKESTKAYKEAINQQKTYNSNVMEIAKQQMNYWGSHHSWNSYWRGFNNEQMNRIRQNVKSDFNGEITSLTPEEMKKLLSDQDLVDTIRKTGKIYKGRSAYGESVLNKLEDYADLAGNLDELTEKWQESITQISFDSMKDNFISNLMDMDKAASDFADDFKEDMQRALLSYSMEDLINGDLKKLYEEWAKKIDEKEGKFSSQDVEDFQARYQKIVDEGLKRRDEIAKITGYTGESSQSQQTATGKGIEAITADQASSLIGIGYAVQSAIEVGNETRKQISVDISSLCIFAEQTANNISEMRDIQYQGLEQLEAINKNTAPIILIREDIASMYKLMKENY
jgi:DNA repair exonuclease SbcCD ATPase subunit